MLLMAHGKILAQGEDMMKLLVAYDGSGSSDAALDDLKVAGLPQDVSAVVISIAEVWLPPPNDLTISAYAEQLLGSEQPFKAWETHAKELTETIALAGRAEQRLRTNFPTWQITSEGTYGSPAWEILAKADEMNADLIVVGSHGRSAVGRLLLGSISQKVLTEAACSVRVARGRIDIDPEPARIVIGFDGSRGANAAVDAVIARKWPDGTEVRLVGVTDVPLDVDMAMMPVIDPSENGAWLLEIANEPLNALRKAGLDVEFCSEIGNPKNVLVDLAEEWHATSIFIGANRWGSRIERFLLGSVASAVASRAHCSVEVVRAATAAAL